MKKAAVIFILFILLFLASCVKSDNNPKNGEMDCTAFLALLEKNGFSYEIAAEKSEEDSFFSVGYKTIRTEEALITIYEYDSNEDAVADAHYVDDGGCTISVPGKEINISWASFPHFFIKDLIIVNYVGENEEIIDFLEKNLGSEFAGYGYINRKNK